MSTITLYHGTPKFNYSAIMTNGELSGPGYLTPRKELAEDYSANNSTDYVVFEIEVDRDLLNYDAEFVNKHCVEASLEAGSVYVGGSVSITNAKATFYEDYEEVE